MIQNRRCLSPIAVRVLAEPRPCPPIAHAVARSSVPHRIRARLQPSTGGSMDIDLATPGLERIVGADSPFDTVAHGLYFGEGPVWDRRQQRFLWTDIIGDTIWQWKPRVGKDVLIHPSNHANGMTFDREGRLVVAGWSARTIWRVEKDGALVTIASRYQGKKFNSPNDIVVRSDGSVYWTDSAGGLVIPGMVGEDLQRQLDIQAVFRLTPQGEVKLTVEDTVYPNGLCFSPDESILYVNDTRLGLIRSLGEKYSELS